MWHCAMAQDDIVPIFADADSVQVSSEVDVNADPVFFPIVFGEIMGMNVAVWAWDRYVLQKSYAKTGPTYWQRNFEEGWKWDHNHWAINFFGHPYQGAMYYGAARGGGYGFYESMLWTALGSFTWEMFAETEYPSSNDLIMTSVGGSVYGEVLYRFSRKLYGTKDASWASKAGAFALHPSATAQRMAFGNRDTHTGNTALDMHIYLGSGSRFGNIYRFGGRNEDDLDEDWDDKHILFGMYAEYGHPYTKMKRPFDYFIMIANGEWGVDGNVAHLDVMGKLHNVNVHGRGNWMDFATYLDYDTFYGDFATIGTVSLGGGFDFSFWLLPSLRFRVMNQIYWIILGTTDMGYDDLIREVHPDYEPDMDNYQYNMGAKYSLYLELLFGNRFRISNRANFDALHTLPNSLPHYGARGWDFLVFNYTKAEYGICSWLDIGSRLDTYIKFASYSSEFFEPMWRTVFAYTVYFSFKLF